MLGTKTRTKNQTETIGALPHMANDSTCVIAEGTFIEGNFSCTENVRLDGTIKGDVSCDSRLVMGPSGKIVGTIQANEGDIWGTVEGNIQVKGLLHLQKSAVIRGNISAGSLHVEEGASYNGESRIGQTQSSKPKGKA